MDKIKYNGYLVTIPVSLRYEKDSVRTMAIYFTRNPLTWCVLKILMFTLRIKLNGFRDVVKICPTYGNYFYEAILGHSNEAGL